MIAGLLLSTLLFFSPTDKQSAKLLDAQKPEELPPSGKAVQINQTIDLRHNKNLDAGGFSSTMTTAPSAYTTARARLVMKVLQY